MSTENHPEGTDWPITPEPLCEGLAPFRCGNPSCPAHGVTGPTTEGASE